MDNPSENLRMTVYASLLAALISAGAYLYVPVGPVPIYLSNLFIYLAGLLLGSRWGLASVGVYLLAGVCGLPVFAGGTAGIGRLVGPTGGYLVSFLPAVWLIGRVAEKSEKMEIRMIFDVLGMICGTIIIYALGVTWLKIVTGMTVGKAVAAGMIPFILGDALKIAAAATIAKALRPLVAGHLSATMDDNLELTTRLSSPKSTDNPQRTTHN